MHALRLMKTKSVPVKYIRARCGVRYWEDGKVNGVEDADGSRIPCREGTASDNDNLGGGKLPSRAHAEDGLEPHQLIAKCEAMLRNGAGWRC